jgi:hypothetical protein
MSVESFFITPGRFDEFAEKLTGKQYDRGIGRPLFSRLMTPNAISLVTIERTGKLIYDNNSRRNVRGRVLARTQTLDEVNAQFGDHAMIQLDTPEDAEALGLTVREFETVTAFSPMGQRGVGRVLSSNFRRDRTHGNYDIPYTPLVGEVIGYDWRPEFALNATWFAAVLRMSSSEGGIHRGLHEAYQTTLGASDLLYEMSHDITSSEVSLLTNRGLQRPSERQGVVSQL